MRTFAEYDHGKVESVGMEYFSEVDNYSGFDIGKGDAENNNNTEPRDRCPQRLGASIRQFLVRPHGITSSPVPSASPG